VWRPSSSSGHSLLDAPWTLLPLDTQHHPPVEHTSTTATDQSHTTPMI
jgi:hypothetical protein